MVICFVFERRMEFKQIICQIPLKKLNIFLFPLAATEFLPSQKQILQTNYFIKEVFHE